MLFQSFLVTAPFSFLGKSIDNAAGSDYDNNINREKDMGTGNHM